jgi:hypothetical protein
MSTIEIDDDVLSFLKSKAEPFLIPSDTPNTVLRRLLLRDAKPIKVVDSDLSDAFPGGTPAALKQILFVIKIMNIKGLTRLSATHKVANYYNFAVQTIMDKYTRQLGITAAEFDGLLSESGRTNLARRLNNKFPGHENLIKEYIL